MIYNSYTIRLTVLTVNFNLYSRFEYKIIYENFLFFYIISQNNRVLDCIVKSSLKSIQINYIDVIMLQLPNLKAHLLLKLAFFSLN